MKTLIVFIVLFASCQSSIEQTTDFSEILVFDKFDEMSSRLNTNSDTTFVMNFWATWCVPCVKELPYFEDLNADKGFEKPVKVVLVSLDEKKHIDKKVVPLIDKKNVKSEVWLLDDPKYNEWIDKVSPEWSGALPGTLIFDKHKRQFEETSFISYTELKNIIDQFIEN